jgi:hypothetical protein
MPVTLSLLDTQKVSNISQKVTDLAIFGPDPHPEQIRKLRSLLLFFLFGVSSYAVYFPWGGGGGGGPLSININLGGATVNPT